MWHWFRTRWIARGCLTLAISIGVVQAEAQAGQSSALSRWLSREVVPELRQLLSMHPRYRGQQVQIAAGGQDALSAAIATLLNANLAGREGIVLTAGRPTAPLRMAAPDSIDTLDCQGSPHFDYLLQASADAVAGAGDQVRLELVDVSGAGEQARSWQWLGKFSSAERRQFNKSLEPKIADGSLGAPWDDREVDAAAIALSRDFACALRPQIKTRLSLQWPESLSLPALFADTANTTRHLLGNYQELGITADQPNYKVEVRVERFRHNTWQLWLTGTPQRNDLAPVQAVTYFEAVDPGWAGPGAVAAVPVTRPADLLPELGEALDFLDIELLDATQADRGRWRADLEVTLRIGNRADWPIEYSFSLSGGHFNHCIARPGYYRHDRYGLVAGSVEAGSSVVRRLIIENAQHRPAPLFGVPKCAGFRDLEGFENFASEGDKVTDFVRWDM